MAKTDDITGHAFVTLDVCFLSYLHGDEHPLKAADDRSYCEMFYDEGRVAFAAPICHACWAARQAEQAETPEPKKRRRS